MYMSRSKPSDRRGAKTKSPKRTALHCTALHCTGTSPSTEAAQLSSADWSRPSIRGRCVGTGTPPMWHVTCDQRNSQLGTNKRCHCCRGRSCLDLRWPALASPDTSPNAMLEPYDPKVAVIQTDASAEGKGRNGTAVQLRPMETAVDM